MNLFRQKKSRFLSILILFCLLGICTACSNSKKQNISSRRMKDLSGRIVKVPTKVNRVADLWPANNQIVLLLGQSKKLVATPKIIKTNYWFQKLDPAIRKVTTPFAGDQVQAEELLALKPDVVISSDPAQIKTAQEAHLPVINPIFKDFNGLKKSVTLTANVLGGKAPKIAKKYNQDLDKTLSLVKMRLNKNKTYPSVVHFVNLTDLTKVDGKDTIVDQWIKHAGARNAVNKSGNQISLTKEELIKLNPDYLIVGQTSTKKALAKFKSDPALAKLKAVKTGHVYGNPQGSFPWDRYSTEISLQVVWAAKLFHPNEMRTVDLKQKIKDFYQKYYHYRLSDREVKQILSGEFSN